MFELNPIKILARYRTNFSSHWGGSRCPYVASMRTQSAFDILSLGLPLTAEKRDFGLNCAMRHSHNPNWNRLARFLNGRIPAENLMRQIESATGQPTGGRNSLRISTR
jgi:hypothetical protein